LRAWRMRLMPSKRPSKHELKFSKLWERCGTGDVPESEFEFFPDRKFRFDFAWPEYLVAVELQGATWVKSGHTSGRGVQRDCEKANLAVLQGWRVLHFTGDDLKDSPERCMRMVGELIRQ